MSLDWNVSKVANFEILCFATAPNGDRRATPITQTLIWASLGTGIGTLKESNYREAFARIAIIEKLNGNFGLRPVTLAEVRAHIGLYTNASFKDETRTKWSARIMESKMRDALYNADRREREAADVERAIEQQAAERAAQ